MKLIDVVWPRVARKAHELELTPTYLAQLLHATRTPLQHRLPPETQRVDHIIARLRRTRERARENLRVRDEEPLLTPHRRPRITSKRREIRRVEHTTLLDYRPLGDIARVKPIEQQHGIHRCEMPRVAKNRANRTVSGAEPNQRHAIHARRRA